MALEVAEIRNRRELREFIYLPAKVNLTNPRWIPPIYMDNWKFFDAKKNRAFQHADAVLALARRDGRVVGARVSKSLHPRLDEAALAAAKRLRFSPGKVDGQATRVRIPYTYVFVLE